MIIEISDQEAGERLDRLLANRLERPRNQLQNWIDDGRVLRQGRPLKASTRLAPGDRIEVEPPTEPREAGLEPEPGQLDVLSEESAFTVINKAAGVAVHPGAGRSHGTLANYLLHRYPEIAGVGGPGRPGIVHRLDQGTTGVMVVARTDHAYHALQRAFAERNVEKQYLAIVYGSPPETGRIDLPIGRHPRDRKKMAVRPEARPADTRYQRRASAAGLAWLEIELLTGRTHQIRVHLKAIGHPLVGDPVYGEARWRGLAKQSERPLKHFPRPALHAWRLAFDHPETGERVRYEAAPPEDMITLWSQVTGSTPPELSTWSRKAATPLA